MRLPERIRFISFAVVIAAGLISPNNANAQLTALPGIIDGEQLKKVNEIYSELTSSAPGQGGKLVPALLDSLSTVDQRGQYQAYTQLRDLLKDPSVIEALVQELKTNKAEIASSLLANTRNYGSTQPEFTAAETTELIFALKSANATVRKNVVQMLAGIQPPNNDTSVQTALIETMLKDPVAYVRTSAASSLSSLAREIYFKNAQPIAAAFSKVLQDDQSVQVRAAAASALSQMGGKASSEAAIICRALTDNSSQVRNSALQAVINIGAPCKAAEAELFDMWNAPVETTGYNQSRDRILQALISIGTPAQKTAPLISTLLKEHNSVNGVIHVIQKMGDEAVAVLPALILVLDSAYAYDREEAARILGQLGSKAKAAVPALKKCSTDTRAVRGYGNADQAQRAAKEAIQSIEGEANRNTATEE